MTQVPVSQRCSCEVAGGVHCTCDRDNMSRQVENACQSSDHEQHAAAAPGECEARREQGGPLPCYVIIHNVSKRHNLGMIARSATAFGVAEVRSVHLCNDKCWLHTVLRL